MAITAILWDLGNVVVHFDNERPVENMARLIGRSTEDVREAMYGFDITPRLVRSYCLGDVDTDEYRALVSRRLGLATDIPEATFMAADADLFRPNRRIIELIVRLRRQGVTMTAVTNIEEMRHRQLQRRGVMSIFDHEVVSYQERLCKPSEELMVRALDRSASKAEDTIFVDDLADNLPPAAGLGINCHLYADFRRFVAFLAPFGIKA